MFRSGLMQLLIAVLGATISPAEQASTLSLAGQWELQLGPDSIDPPLHAPLEHAICLPGNVAGSGYGHRCLKIADVPDRDSWARLSPLFTYSGVAWFARDVSVPQAWLGKPLELFLERCHWVTRVWWDGHFVGERKSLSVPHRYEVVQSATPGKHRLIVAVDNRYVVEVGKETSALGHNTHTNWNGILGRLELRALEPLRIVHVHGAPHSNSDTAELRMEYISPPTPALEVQVSIINDTSGVIVGETSWRGASAAEGVLRLRLALHDVNWWDEDSRATYTVFAAFADYATPEVRRDEAAYPFPMRRIQTEAQTVLLNDVALYFRGTIDTGVFPNAGVPPTDLSAWTDRLEQVQAFGLNHVRFHSWCPPEAAFAAADALGVYLQVELPANTTVDSVNGSETIDFLRGEMQCILREYGNHPSFLLMAMGNQMDGDWATLDALVADAKREDPRRLYTYTSDHARLAPGPTSDYLVTLGITGRARFRRHEAYNGGDLATPAANHNVDDLLTGMGQPCIYHEIGQWAMHPDWRQISDYLGLLKPLNLIEYRQKAMDAGLAPLAASFARASETFAGRLLKEDVEAARRSRLLSGFQWYQLRDLPGLGEAMVGGLDAVGNPKRGFHESGVIAALAPIVPLLRTDKLAWSKAEMFRGILELSNLGRRPLLSTTIKWSLSDAEQHTLAQGQFGPQEFGVGLTKAGELEIALGTLTEPSCLTFRAEVQGTSWSNSWNLWVYPHEAVAIPPSVRVVHRFDASAGQRLCNGENLIWFVQNDDVSPAFRPMRFLPVTKSRSIFSGQPSSMGLLVDAQHPALHDFPTAFHADWQWWGPTHAPARMMCAPNLDSYFEPIVRVIPDFHTPEQSVILAQARVAAGNLLICTLPLLDRQHDPAARQLLQSIVNYAASKDFAPARQLTLERLQDTIETKALTP